MESTQKTEFLDDRSREILQLYKKSLFTKLTLHDLVVKTELSDMHLAPTINYLRKRGYLKIDPDYELFHKDAVDKLRGSITVDTPLCITREGEVALEEYEYNHKQLRSSNLRSWIALGVSIASLTVAIIALLLR